MTSHAPCLAGQIVFQGEVHSLALGTNRVVRVYLPPNYEQSPARRYPVLYLHDGQNMFSVVGAHAAFGWGPWDLDRTVNSLIAAREMAEIIMVSIDCGEHRYHDYLGPNAGSRDRFDRYARFLVSELKPKIDTEYRTSRAAESTAVMGSSMGGLCSLALAWEHSDVFGLVASMSGAFQAGRRHFVRNILGKYVGHRKPFRVYLDSGTLDDAGGDDGRRDTVLAVNELRRIGWRDGQELCHYVEEEIANVDFLVRSGLNAEKQREAIWSQHNEFYWRIRAWRALKFMFPMNP